MRPPSSGGPPKIKQPVLLPPPSHLETVAPKDTTDKPRRNAPDGAQPGSRDALPDRDATVCRKAIFKAGDGSDGQGSNGAPDVEPLRVIVRRAVFHGQLARARGTRPALCRASLYNRLRKRSESCSLRSVSSRHVCHFTSILIYCGHPVHGIFRLTVSAPASRRTAP